MQASKTITFTINLSPDEIKKLIINYILNHVDLNNQFDLAKTNIIEVEFGIHYDNDEIATFDGASVIAEKYNKTEQI